MQLAASSHPRKWIVALTLVSLLVFAFANTVSAQQSGLSEPWQFENRSSQTLTDDPYLSGDPSESFGDSSCPSCEQQAKSWQFLPNGLLYKSYLAGPRESRFASTWLYERDRGWLWEIALGSRFGIVRHGTSGDFHPKGFQLDFEGGAFPRLDIENKEDLEAVDFRFGLPLTWADGPFHLKLGYYHISSHVGDEFLKRNPTFQRVNYVRDSILLGVGYYLTNTTRVYAEAAWGFNVDVAEPWEFEFGVEYSPQCDVGVHGTPFAAADIHLYEENDFGGQINLISGWQWRSEISDRLLRVGAQYFNGKSIQRTFFNEHEQLLGVGVWLDY